VAHPLGEAANRLRLFALLGTIGETVQNVACTDPAYHMLTAARTVRITLP